MSPTITKLTGYKIAPEDLLDMSDLASIANSYASVTRCPGGRYIQDGYMCLHCGSDTSKLFDEKGEEVFQREPGVRYVRRCGESVKKMLATDLSTRITGSMPLE